MIKTVVISALRLVGQNVIYLCKTCYSGLVSIYLRIVASATNIQVSVIRLIFVTAARLISSGSVLLETREIDSTLTYHSSHSHRQLVSSQSEQLSCSARYSEAFLIRGHINTSGASDREVLFYNHLGKPRNKTLNESV